MSSKRLMWLATLLMVFALMAVGCTGAAPVEEEEAPAAEEEAVEEPAVEEEAEEPAAEEGAEEPAEEAAEEPVIRLAAMSLGTVDDQSWNYQMQQAVLRVGEERGYDVTYAENVAPADVERVIREYADSGYNLIINDR